MLKFPSSGRQRPAYPDPRFEPTTPGPRAQDIAEGDVLSKVVPVFGDAVTERFGRRDDTLVVDSDLINPKVGGCVCPFRIGR